MSIVTNIKPGPHYYPQLYEFLRTLQLPLDPGERRIHENICRHRRALPYTTNDLMNLRNLAITAEGILLMTNQNLYFYVVNVNRYPGGFSIIIKLPLIAIRNMSVKDTGALGRTLSILAVETDTTLVTGDPHQEFLLINANEWQNNLESMIRKRRAEDQIAGGSPHRPHAAAQARQSGGKDCLKVCLNCMAVVPEQSAVCPKCGHQF